MTNELQFYNKAKAALAKAVKVDEVKKIHNTAAAMKAAAKVAKDTDMETKAAEIRTRAERRLGELIAEQKKTVGLSAGTRGSKKKGARVDDKPTLKEAGIDKNTAHRARTEAAKSPEQFEQDIAAEKERITKPKPVAVSEEKKSKKKKPKVIASLTDQCVEYVRATVEDTLQQMRRGHAAQEKFMHLFAALKDLVDDLESKTLPPLESVEESAERRRAVNAKLAEEDVT
jgi:hypothetical protein